MAASAARPVDQRAAKQLCAPRPPAGCLPRRTPLRRSLRRGGRVRVSCLTRPGSNIAGAIGRQRPPPRARVRFSGDGLGHPGEMSDHGGVGPGTVVALEHTWEVGAALGSGGFGQVFEAEGPQAAAIKFVPKMPGADRELLFADIPSAPSIMPVIDSGEHGDFWVIVMPRADGSLRQTIELTPGEPLPPETAITILLDVCDALVALGGRVVHRDLKPENILRLGDNWVVADFGIARYAEATTAPETQKYAFSAPYCAPERWRHERATTSSDIYSFGVLAFELLTSSWPFPGPRIEDFREQHLHHPAPSTNLPKPLGSLIDECLFKAAEARPSPSNVRARLERALEGPRLQGLAALQQANQENTRRASEAARAASVARTDAERRAALADAAGRLHAGIAEELVDAIRDAAPTARVTQDRRGRGFVVRLGDATLTMTGPDGGTPVTWGGWDPPAFDVVSFGEIRIDIPIDRSEYAGRSHSLWYGDVQVAGQYGWFEVAFMVSPLMPYRTKLSPAALDPGEDAAKAVWSGMAEVQLAWPFSPLVPGELDDFIDRWATWLALGSTGSLSYPSSMPERPTQGSFRRNT